MTDAKGLTIGKLAEKAGVNVETVRYYQRIGLMATPAKPAQGYRTYKASEVERLRFIKRAQELGFSLAEVTELLSLGKSHCHEVQQLAEAKLQSVEARIRDFQKMRHALQKLVEGCRNASDGESCPLITSLSEGRD